MIESIEWKGMEETMAWFWCVWCEETIDAEYIVLWHESYGKKVDVAFLHWECEEDFRRDAGKIRWKSKTFEADPVIYIDPVAARWRAARED